MSPLSPSIFADLIGRPFEAGARGPEKYDCVGLSLEIARRLGKQVPDYISSEAELHRQLVLDMATGSTILADCPQIPRAVPGCVVLLRMTPNQHHLAFMVDEYRMIHTTKATGCVIERVISPLWLRKVIGYYSLQAEGLCQPK